MSDTIIRALKLAGEVHKDQSYRGGSYMDNHIIPVLEKVSEYTNDEDALVAAILHDAVEDSNGRVTVDDIRSQFNDRTGFFVWCVTDEPGASRQERKTLTYRKISGNYFPTLIKLADRIINTSGEKKAMYQKEYPHFRIALKKAGVLETLWKELDNLTKD